MKFRLKYVIPSFLFVLIFLVGLLASTHTGLLIIQKSITFISSGRITVERVEGRLLDGFTLNRFTMQHPQFDLHVEEFRLSWRSAALLRGALHVEELKGAAVDVLLKDDSVTEYDFVLPPVLPFGVMVEEMAVLDFKLHGQNEEVLFALDTINASIEGETENIEIHTFELQGPDIGLELSGSLIPGTDWQVALGGKWRLAGFGFHQMQGIFQLDGAPGGAMGVDVTLENPGHIRVRGILNNLLQEPQWTASLEAKDFDLSTWIKDCPEIKLSRVSGDMAGDFRTYGGKVLADGAWGAFDKLHLESEIAGDGLGILFHSLRIDRDNGYAQADGGSISWEKLFSWKADLEVENFNIQLLVEQLPGNLNGTFASIGDVNETGLDVVFDIDRIDGSLQKLNVFFRGILNLDESGVYTDGLLVKSGDIEGQAQIVKALFQWDEKAAWGCEVLLDKFNPAIIHPDLPGGVNGVLVASGYWSEKGMFGSLELSDISGELRGNELRGSGSVIINEDSVESSGLHLGIGDTEFHIHGGMNDEFDLTFRLNSPDLNDVLPNVAGILEIEGEVSGSVSLPQLEIGIGATALQFEEYGMASLQGRLFAEIVEDGAVDITLAGQNMTLLDVVIDGGSLTISGTRLDHKIEAIFAGDGLEGGIKGDGICTGVWNGRIRDIYLQTAAFGVWEQRGGSALHIDRNNVVLDELCFGYGQGRGCVDGELQLTDALDWSVTAEIDSIPLSLFNRVYPIPSRLLGTVGAYATFRGNRERLQEGLGSIRMADTILQVDGEEVEGTIFSFPQSSLDLVLVDQEMRVKGAVNGEDGGAAEWNLNISDFGSYVAEPSAMKLGGDLVLRDLQVGILGDLIHHGVQPKGLVNGILAFEGSVDDPQVVGNLELMEGGVELPYQGILLKDIKISLETNGSNTKVKGSLVSGDGDLFVDGQVGYGEKGITGALHLTGNEFLLVSLPEYAIEVDPDVIFEFDQEKGEINGRVEVPFGRIVPEELSNSVKASEDVVLVGGEEEKQNGSWPFYLDLEVALGEDVTIDGYGLTGLLGGNLKVKSTPDDFITGRGQLDLLDGKYSIYGRTLDIERGRVIFSGGPIENPGVDVRAQKVVSDEEAAGEGYTVGVDISGLVQDLKFHLFSTPYMADSEILSHMILGHALAGSNAEEGNILQAAAETLGIKGGSALLGRIGNLLFIDEVHLEGSAQKENVSLVVGKRITDDLYIGYDMNMFSQLGQFRIRYDLVKGFWVETRSSSESTGADLMFSFEK